MELKTLRKATPQEVDQLAKKKYERSESMQQYIVKNYDFYITKDNLFLEVHKFNKLSITKIMYYDDEREAPQKNIDNFIYYNRRNANTYDIYKDELQHLCNFWLCNNNDYNVYINYDRFNEKPQNTIRETTKEEMQDILTIYKKQQENYTERLKIYYNRYNKHIYASGYWANR
jgi:predicted DNA-binding WGR domain protein